MKIWTAVKCMGGFQLKPISLVVNSFSSVVLFRTLLRYVKGCKFFLHHKAFLFLWCKRIAWWGVCVSWSKELYLIFKLSIVCVCIHILFSFSLEDIKVILFSLKFWADWWAPDGWICPTVAGGQCSPSRSDFFVGSCKRYLLCSMLYAFQGLSVYCKFKTRRRNSNLRNISLTSYNFRFWPPV